MERRGECPIPLLVSGEHTRAHEREETERRANGLESGENGLSPLLFTLRSENTQLSSSLDPSPSGGEAGRL